MDGFDFAPTEVEVISAGESESGGGQLVESVSIENMIAQRDAAVSLFAQAQELLWEADRILNFAGFDRVKDCLRSRRGYSDDTSITESDAIEIFKKRLDASGWQTLMNKSGLLTFMTAKKKEKWREDVENLRTPEFTKENIEATFVEIYGNRLNMMEEGVLNVFKSISFCYKTNSPKMFGKKIILDFFFSGDWISDSTTDKIDDLLRVMFLVEGKPQADARYGIKWMVSDLIKKGDKFFENEYIHLKWYKSAKTAHITFKNIAVVDKLNKILAKHYPFAIPYDRDAEINKGAEMPQKGYPATVDSFNNRFSVHDIKSSDPKDYGFFPTPPKVVEMVLELADIKKGMSCLEPSAGDGAIAKPMNDIINGYGSNIYASIDCYEFLPENVKKLTELGLRNVYQADFMQASEHPTYDRIVMNPPFSRNQDRVHVLKAWRLLKGGGRLVAIMGAGVKSNQDTISRNFREFVTQYKGRFIDLPEGSFKESGTMVNSVVLILDKPEL